MSSLPPPFVATPRTRAVALGLTGLVVLTSGLIVLGALVRAHGAGLACPDWPLCFGEVVPEFDLKVAFEWGHRVVAGTVGLLFLGLSGALLSEPATRARLSRWVVVTGVVLGIQVLLGALTVWELLAEWTVTSHLVTGNFFNLLLLLGVLRLRDLAVPPRHARPTAGVRRMLWLVAVLLTAQMVLGGLVASGYAGLACPEWPTCNGGTWFPAWRGSVGLHLAHRMNGYALGISLLAAAWSSRHAAVVRSRAALAALIGFGQVLVGIANVLLGIPVEVTGLHSALAAALVLCVAASLHACYNAGPEAPLLPGEETR